MIFGMFFSFEHGTQNFYRVRTMLMSEFGLVGPRYGRLTEDDVLVWEDDLPIGRYRVHFYPADDKQNYDAIQFKYWLNKRMKREIFERDPMRESMQRVRETLEGAFQENIIGKDWTIDEVLRSNDE